MADMEDGMPWTATLEGWRICCTMQMSMVAIMLRMLMVHNHKGWPQHGCGLTILRMHMIVRYYNGQVC